MISNNLFSASVTAASSRRMAYSSIKLGQSTPYSGNVAVYDIRTSLTSLSIMTEGHLPENAIVGSATVN